MGDTSTIEWTDATWNPVTGCTKVSPGCDHCYAEGIANRFRGPAFPNGFDVTLREKRLREPMTWRKPRRIFVNSMSDLFHEAIPDAYIAQVFAVMSCTPQHTYQVLTKRHGRLRSLLSRPDFERMVLDAKVGPQWTPLPGGGWEWPLRNVWLGVSVENQQWADIRIPALLDTPAAVRFLSCEPLLGPVDIKFSQCREHDFPGGMCTFSCPLRTRVDWVIVGGESGAGARPMDPAWVERIRDDCGYSDTAFFFKQWGSHDEHGKRMSKHAAGRLLDGQTWDEYPTPAAALEPVSSGCSRPGGDRG